MDNQNPKTTNAQANAPEDILQKLNQLEGRITALEQQQNNIIQDEIWTTKDVADYAKCSYHYVVQQLIHLQDFPKSIGNPKPRSPKKYRASEIINYFKNRNNSHK
ncbi:TPA: hypothetical protein ACPDS2_000634 [Pasteurella multocida]|uniref:Uncharacterized protein n=2 Tax=Pasteurella multocida TaxID=747 RepID=A0A9X3ZK27_PASMD|nr:hypothetical protein [Pasteurella multocida]MBF6980755.1 hypothetical protein [Pasteurella multocida]MBF6985502.1 hypothetical protein [Pasteurella multocida]MDA5610578.1 hypothetical protein [Pasteurella multocida]MDA5613296.1 hypothetical protein [Pasteurella multocida]MDA5617308.1 hypothetical protein [Pasteurella multocida subsp. multocida]